MGDANMVKITLNGKTLQVEENQNLIEVARSIGEEIPHFCYHPGLSVAGQCRLCLVEIEGIPKLQPACAIYPKEGMVVHTQTERVKRLQAQVMEFLLINHPLDCPICDQAGECDLQDFTERYSFPKSRYTEEKRVYPGLERRLIGPHVFQNQNRCIHCSRCIRFCEEIAETGELTFVQRGHRMAIDTKDGKPLDNPWSACAADVCPVGALTVYDFRFKERVWNLESHPSICPHCGNGCHIFLEHRRGIVKRFLPKQCDEINHYWLCDHGRFSFSWMNQWDRVDGEVKGKLASWEEIFQELSQRWQEAEHPVCFITPFQSEEEVELIQKLFSKVYLMAEGGPQRRIKNKKREWLASTAQGPNQKGILDRKIPQGFPKKISGDLIFIFEQGYPRLWSPQEVERLSRSAFVVVDSRWTDPLSQRADVVIPGALFHEKSGTYVNDHGIRQHVKAAVEPPPGVKRAEDYLKVLLESQRRKEG